MQVTGKIVCVYPEISGTYLGTSYRNIIAIIMSDNTIDGTNIHDRYVIKFKNTNIELAKSSGCLEGSDSYLFTLIADVTERYRHDGTPFAISKPMVCINIEKIL